MRCPLYERTASRFSRALKQSEDVFLSVQQLCNVVLGLSQHIGCDLLCFSNTSTGSITYKDKNSISAITDLLGFSLGVGGKQKESSQRSQQPQSDEHRKNYLLGNILEHPPTSELVSTYIERL